MDNINALLESIKTALDTFFTYAFGLVLISAVLRFIFKRIKADGLGKGFYFGVLAFGEACVAFLIIYLLPLWLASALEKPELAVSFRWILLYISCVPYWWRNTRKFGGRRGLFSSLLVLTVFLFGWQFDRWIGVLFISLPILGVFIFLLDKLAQVILPAADPDNLPDERLDKTKAFIAYMLGTQYPVWVANSKADRKFDQRIPGGTFDKTGEPGILWTWSHQVAGLSTGINFAGVSGPGMVFINQYERPIALVDTRTQLRVTTPETTTKDGIKVTVVVFTAFKVKDVRVALRRMGIAKALKEKGNEDLTFYWDEWVIKQVDDAARQVVAERELDRLWRPNKPGDSALDELADAMKTLLITKLLHAGIEIYTARIVNFDLKETDEEDKKIIEQQLDSWRTNWEQKITQAEAEINAIYREELEKAHAFAKSALLETVAESLENARRINKKLPRHVIAQYYIHALDEYIKKQPGLNAEEIKERVENLQHVLLFSRERNE